jgi:hypothetical protein
VSDAGLICPRCDRELPAQPPSDVCPGCGHLIRRCANCGDLLPAQPQERCPNAACRARVLYLPVSGGQPTRVLHLYAEVVYNGVPLRVDGLLRQPNDGTTLYRVSATNERAFRKRFHEAPPRRAGEQALVLKEMVLECRGAPAGRNTTPEEFAALIARVSALRHPGIVRTYAGWEEAGKRYVLMQRLEGPNLGEHFLRGERPGSGPPAGTLMRAARALAEAVEYLHRQGIWHRDITPTNVVWEDGRPVLVDLGNAVLANTNLNGRAPLTHRYAPLEMYADSSLPIDHRVDQYLLGSLLFCLAWGVPADFYLERTGLHAVALAPDRARALRRGEGDPQRRVSFYRADLPASFARTIDRLMAVQPEDRFGSDAEMRKALAARRAGLPLPLHGWRGLVLAGLTAFGGGWLGVEVSPGVRAEWHLRQATHQVTAGETPEALRSRQTAQSELREGVPALWEGRLAAARRAYGQACLAAGWRALNRGQAREGAVLAKEALNMLGTANSASARELLRRCRTISPE